MVYTLWIWTVHIFFWISILLSHREFCPFFCYFSYIIEKTLIDVITIMFWLILNLHQEDIFYLSRMSTLFRAIHHISYNNYGFIYMFNPANTRRFKNVVCRSYADLFKSIFWISWMLHWCLWFVMDVSKTSFVRCECLKDVLGTSYCVLLILRISYHEI